jgi:polar amino acid transport system substrate-binding protein
MRAMTSTESSMVSSAGNTTPSFPERPLHRRGPRSSHSRLPISNSTRGIAINSARTPNVTSVDDLAGLTVGIQKGNTSDSVAKRLLAQGLIADIRYYPYHGMSHALTDLDDGHIGAIIKLFPVISWFVRDHPQLRVVTTVPTHEQLGIAYAKTNIALRVVMNEALQKLRTDGSLEQLNSRWFSERPSLK